MLTVDVPPIASDRDWLVYMDKRAPAGTIAGRVERWAAPMPDVPLPGQRFEVETFGNA